MLAALGGCAQSFLDDLDLTRFEQAPNFEQGFDLSQLKPAEPFDYIELRWRRLSEGVLASHGELCAQAIDRAACEADFRAMESATPFRAAGDQRSYYYAVNRGDTNSTAGSRAELLALFGTIDAPEEALSLARADGYHWGWAKEDGAYRRVDDGFELIVLRLTDDCAPVETKRYLLWVRGDGSLQILADEIKDSDSGACS